MIQRIFRLPSRAVLGARVGNRTRRRALRVGLALVLLMAAGLGDASFVEPYWIEVTHHRTPFAGLPQELKIAHLTDLHIREWGRRERRLLQLLDEERPDWIVITGDTTSPGVPDAVRHELLSWLHAPLGVFAVGRHPGPAQRTPESLGVSVARGPGRCPRWGARSRQGLRRSSARGSLYCPESS